jgi:hypothetical protein
MILRDGAMADDRAHKAQLAVSGIAAVTATINCLINSETDIIKLQRRGWKSTVEVNDLNRTDVIDRRGSAETRREHQDDGHKAEGTDRRLSGTARACDQSRAERRPQNSTSPRFIAILLAGATKVLIMKEATVKVLIAKEAREKI